MPLSEIAALELEPKRVLGNPRPRWLVNVRLTDAGLINPLEAPRQEEAEALADRLSGMLGVSSEHV